MNFDDYQAAARRTMNTGLSREQQQLDAAAGMAEEAGEALGIIRKHLFQQHPLDRERVTKELGDVLWCVAAVATSFDISLDAAAQANIEKLRRRYPEGFTVEGSMRRGDEAAQP
jgi:NTP pyrophosphatase (non-canonical NTP hydrolase)